MGLSQLIVTTDQFKATCEPAQMVQQGIHELHNSIKRLKRSMHSTQSSKVSVVVPNHNACATQFAVFA
jgi:hypothetical protein